jgi:hypothetical protein
MHPEILRDLVLQHGCELREQARRTMMARIASRARRPGRRSAESRDRAGDFAVPAIPDYVDGSFRTAEDEAAGRVPAARHTA